MSLDAKNLIATYPRTRRAMPPKLASIYQDIYLTSRDGKTFLYRITQALEGWMHRKVAAGSAAGRSVLEVGGGTLNQLKWESAGQTYDVVEPWKSLYDGRPEMAKVRAFYADVADVPRENRYDRIISIATLEHVLDLPRMVAEAAIRLAPGGTFSAGIPSEGGMLWGLSWRASVGLAFRLRTGLNYGDLMRHEHVSGAREIRAVVSYFFHRCRVKRFPTPLHHLSLYTFLDCEEPRLDRCQAILDSRDRR